MMQHVQQECGLAPACIMAGGAAWKMAPHMGVPVELIDNLIFEGLLVIAEQRYLLNI
jgi:type III pantothenate kinase